MSVAVRSLLIVFDCITGVSVGCISKDGWTMSEEYIETVLINSDDVYLVVSLEVGGFRSVPSSDDKMNVPNAEISFLFDTVCSDKCDFLFFMVTIPSLNYCKPKT